MCRPTIFTLVTDYIATLGRTAVVLLNY